MVGWGVSPAVSIIKSPWYSPKEEPARETGGRRMRSWGAAGRRSRTRVTRGRAATLRSRLTLRGQQVRLPMALVFQAPGHCQKCWEH